MKQFWKNTMETLLRDILYRDKNKENRLWTDEYPYDVEKMPEDVKDFYKAVDDKSQLFALATAINQELEEPCSKSEEAWYTEAWYDVDLENALEELGVPVTAENIRRLRKGCKGLFDDKSGRNEMILEKASEIFKLD